MSGSANPGLTSDEASRLRKLEFVHDIGLIPILKMGGSQPDKVVEKQEKLSETVKVKTEKKEEEEEEAMVVEKKFDVTMLLPNLSRLCEPSSNSEKKSYEELEAENLELKQLLEVKLAEVERNHEVILDENELLTKEILEMQKNSKKRNERLEESELQRLLLHRKLEGVKRELQEMTDMMAALIKESMAKSNSTGDNDNSDLSDNSKMQVDSEMYTSGSSLPPPDTTIISGNDSIFDSIVVTRDSGTQTETEDVGHSELQVAVPSPLQICQEGTSSPSNVVNAPEDHPTSTNQPTCLELVPVSITFPSVPPKPSETSEASNDTTTSSVESPSTSSLHAVDTSKQSKWFYCTCGSHYSTKNGLTSHLHCANGLLNFPCPHCDKRFLGNGQLRIHLKNTHGLKHKSGIGCRMCGEEFATRTQIVLHYKNDHPTDSVHPKIEAPEEPSSSKDLNAGTKSTVSSSTSQPGTKPLAIKFEPAKPAKTISLKGKLGKKLKPKKKKAVSQQAKDLSKPELLSQYRMSHDGNGHSSPRLLSFSSLKPAQNTPSRLMYPIKITNSSLTASIRYKCHLCPDDFLWLDQLKNHLQRVHKETGGAAC